MMNSKIATAQQTRTNVFCVSTGLNRRASVICLSSLLILFACQRGLAEEKHKRLGQVLGVLDAVLQAAADAERHDQHYSDDHESSFKEGYEQGYGSVASRADMDTANRAAFDDGKALGASDASHRYSDDYRRHSDRYIAEYEGSFKKGYEAGYIAMNGPRDHLETWDAEGRLQADVRGAQALLSADEALTIQSIPLGSGKVFNGRKIRGYQSDAYAVAVPAGAILRVEISTQNKAAYFNVHNTKDQSGTAVHRGEVDGAIALIKVNQPGTYVIRPFLERAAARNGETAEYTMWIDVNPQ